jgi:hypothetical protein
MNRIVIVMPLVAVLAIPACGKKGGGETTTPPPTATSDVVAGDVPLPVPEASGASGHWCASIAQAVRLEAAQPEPIELDDPEPYFGCPAGFTAQVGEGQPRRLCFFVATESVEVRRQEGDTESCCYGWDEVCSGSRL